MESYWRALSLDHQFRDRHDGGKFLAGKLKQYANDPDVIILALPRGGVPVGYEVAKALHAPLDVFIVRKLGVPIHEELAMGAIASGGVLVLNEDIIRKLGITKNMLEATVAEEQHELERREHLYRRNRGPLNVTGKVVILVDDGLATGATMRAAVRALQKLGPKRIIAAVPIGAAETCEHFDSDTDEVICAKAPEIFDGVGAWYKDFTQTTDEEVCGLLKLAEE